MDTLDTSFSLIFISKVIGALKKYQRPFVEGSCAPGPCLSSPTAPFLQISTLLELPQEIANLESFSSYKTDKFP